MKSMTKSKQDRQTIRSMAEKFFPAEKLEG